MSNIICNEELRKIYPNLDSDQYQPNGIDMKLKKLYYISKEDNQMVGLFPEGKSLPDHVEIEPNFNDEYVLQPNVPYIAQCEDSWVIPDDIVQFYYPRSTLWRMGVVVNSSVGDTGFNGKIMVYLRNTNPFPVYLSYNERLIQAVSHRVDTDTRYDGDYNCIGQSKL